MTSNVWHRWQFLFTSENKLKDKLIHILERLKGEREGVWHHSKNYNIKKAFKHAAEVYAKTQKTQDAGKFIINFENKDIIIWIKQSFYYEIDICVPVDEDTSIENIIKNFEKVNLCGLEEGTLVCGSDTTCNFIKEQVLLDLQEDIISWSVLLNFYKYQPKLEVGALKVEATVEKLLNVSLSKISADYTAISKTANTYLFYASEYTSTAPLFFIQFHDKSARCVETHGRTDMVHDIISLHLAAELLKKEKLMLFEIECKISESDDRIYTLIEDTIKSEHEISGLKKEFLNVLNLKKNLSKRNDSISEIRRTTRGITEILNGIDEKIIQGGGIIKHFCDGVEERNEHINFLMKKLYKNSDSLEETTLEAISTETLSGIHRSISVQEQMSGILKSTHMMHAGILILEIVIFAEIIITLIEAYPGYNEFPEIVKFELVIAAMCLGVTCSILLTRFIVRNKIMERILG